MLEEKVVGFPIESTSTACFDEKAHLYDLYLLSAPGASEVAPGRPDVLRPVSVDRAGEVFCGVRRVG
jgi:hypothetical protein